MYYEKQKKFVCHFKYPYGCLLYTSSLYIFSGLIIPHFAEIIYFPGNIPEIFYSIADGYRPVSYTHLGLQSSDRISTKGEIVAGPYHPAFGQLVKSRIAYNRLLEIGKVHNDVYTAYVPGRELSDYIGQNKCNVIALKERFGYKDVLIKPIN